MNKPFSDTPPNIREALKTLDHALGYTLFHTAKHEPSNQLNMAMIELREQIKQQTP